MFYCRSPPVVQKITYRDPGCGVVLRANALEGFFNGLSMPLILWRCHFFFPVMSKPYVAYSLTYKSKFLFLLHNQESIHLKINVSVLLDVIMYPYQLVKITLD